MTATRRYVLFGHPVGHSWSPFIYGLFARQLEDTIDYKLVDVAPGDFRKAVIRFFVGRGHGANITVPHKQAAAEVVNELTPRAERAGAVNSIAVRTEAKLLGDNTDGIGLVADLQKNLGIELAGKRILLLGAGGAVRGVLEPLLLEEPDSVVIANRTAARASELARDFSDLGNVTGGGLEAIGLGSWDLVINGTSASLAGEVPDLPDGVFGPDTWCYDMAYGRGDTPFTSWATARGAKKVRKGFGMLVEQAAESYRLWRGVRPDTAPALKALSAL